MAKETAAQERSERIANATRNRDFDYFAKNYDNLTSKEMKDVQSDIKAKEDFDKYVSDMKKKGSFLLEDKRR